MDRFTRGLVAGILGGIAMNLWTLIALFLLILDVFRFVDWSGVLLFGHPPDNHIEGALALIMQILWAGVLGVIFSFMIKVVTSRLYLIKGAVFGLFLGFIIYSLPVLLQTPYISSHNFNTVLSNHIGGLIWGLTSSYSLHWIDKHIG